MTAADLAARVYYLETRLIQTDAALKAERTRVAILQDTCDAWAKAFGTQTARRAAALARPSDALAQVAGGAPRRYPLPAFGAESHGVDDGDRGPSYSEWLEERYGGRE